MATIRDRYVLEVVSDGAVRGLNSVSTAGNAAAGSMRGLRTAAGALTGVLAGIGAAEFVRSVAEVSARTEDLKTALETVTGSAENANNAFDFISDFARTTPFDVENLTEAFIKLKSAGIEPTEELLTAFGDAASVSTDRVGSLQAMADLFSRTTSGGLGLEDLNRLADRGINVFGILEEQLGITRLEVSEFGKTAEGAQQIRDALVAGFNEDFGGGMARASDNLSVSFSNLGIAANEALLAVGEGGLSQGLQYAAEAMNGLLGSNTDLAESLGSILGEAIIKITDFITGLIDKFEEGGPAVDALKSAFDTAVETFTVVYDSFARIAEAIAPLTDKLLPALAEVFGFVGEAIQALVEPFSNFVLKISEALTETENFTEGVKVAWDGLKTFVTDVVSGLVDAVIGLFQGLYDALWGNSIIRDLIDGIIEGFTGLDVDLLNIVRELVDGVIETFKELFGAIVDGIGGAIDAGLEKLRSAFRSFKEWFYGDSDAVQEAADGTKDALEAALNGDGLTAEAIEMSSEAVLELANQLRDIQDPIQGHINDLESIKESNESITESIETITEYYEEFSEIIEDLGESFEDLEDPLDTHIEQLEDILENSETLTENITELNETYSSFSETVDAVTESFENIKEPIETHLGHLDSMAEKNDIILEKIQEISEDYEEFNEIIEDLSSGFDELESPMDTHIEQLGEISEANADLVSVLGETKQSYQELGPVVQSLNEVYAGSRTATETLRNSVNSLREAITSGINANRSYADSFRQIVSSAESAAAAASRAATQINSAISAQNRLNTMPRTSTTTATASSQSRFRPATATQPTRTSTNPFTNLLNTFAGFFADGGMIGAGKFGVVGERGPELVTGPASVFPMNQLGGSQSVVYNINAVDARSFKELVASDPEFIHAVSQKGARRTSGGRL